MFLQEIIPLPIILYVSCIKKNVTDIEKLKNYRLL